MQKNPLVVCVRRCLRVGRFRGVHPLLAFETAWLSVNGRSGAMTEMQVSKKGASGYWQKNHLSLIAIVEPMCGRYVT